MELRLDLFCVLMLDKARLSASQKDEYDDMNHSTSGIFFQLFFLSYFPSIELFLHSNVILTSEPTGFSSLSLDSFF
jgi:hypothetical protein